MPMEDLAHCCPSQNYLLRITCMFGREVFHVGLKYREAE